MGKKIKASHSRFITIEEATPGMENKITTDFFFHTGKFVWKVKFNTPLDASTVNNSNLYVTNSAGLPVKADIHYNSASREIEIETLDTYDAKQSYILHITTKVQSLGGQNLKEPIEVKFRL
ncbi:Ig-like domain-containing protein [[Clostridium] polysaccharolyticum]|uniref:Ig-like domain-containing protein n=1 Tax=[Clostridium] polysaccharolyticum TaxID=29364 RepID=A0A1I0ERK6_9FIRM|nr:Ig-like domain-containing protein [[Clostridium] polysaccharolyticum]SET48158.1 Ig-like domain-containing protein [[Clostridium] polysaccharolyticum]